RLDTRLGLAGLRRKVRVELDLEGPLPALEQLQLGELLHRDPLPFEPVREPRLRPLPDRHHHRLLYSNERTRPLAPSGRARRGPTLLLASLGRAARGLPLPETRPPRGDAARSLRTPLASLGRAARGLPLPETRPPRGDAARSLRTPLASLGRAARGL